MSCGKYFLLLSLYATVIVAVTQPELNDIEQAELINQQDIIYNSGKFEGDILIKRTRNGEKNPIMRWPNRIVPYELDSMYYTQLEAQKIHEAVKEIGRKTCVNGRYNQGCTSHVGRQGGRQQINLGRECLSLPSTIMHEFVHAIGFYHEQSNLNRDKYITINWNNIQRGYEYAFDTYDSTNFGLPYDYGSIMHYIETAFSKNGILPTIVPKDPRWIGQVGKSPGLTMIDALKINTMYRC